jgi:hypothetical protein
MRRMPEHHSPLTTHFWDVRASIEAQMRCLTTLQQTFTAFRDTSDLDVRTVLRARMFRDLATIEGLTFSVLRMMKPTMEEAKRELNVA